MLFHVFSSGVMARLPFGQNPFADATPAPSSSQKPLPTTSALERQTIAINIEKVDNSHQKRKTQTDLAKQDPKKSRTSEKKGDSQAESAASFFGFIASEHFLRAMSKCGSNARKKTPNTTSSWV